MRNDKRLCGLHRLKKKLKNFFSWIAYGLLLAVLPPRRPTEATKDIAVVCLAALGDFITFCDVARTLHQQGYPLILICRQDVGIDEFAALTGCFKKIEALPHQLIKRVENIRRLKRVQAHTVLIAPVERHILSDLYVLSVSAEQRIFPDTIQGCSLPTLRHLVDCRADKLVTVTERNEQGRYEQYLREFNINNGEIRPYVLEGLKEKPRVGCRDIAIFPGAGGGAAKRWPVERFAYVAAELHQEYGGKVMIFGTAEERALGQGLCAMLPGYAKNLCGETSVSELVEYLQGCALVLANDSGSAHLSIACGRPTVIICGGWEYGRFYPNPRLPPNCRAVVAELGLLKCIPCNESCPVCTDRNAAACILLVEQERVLKTAKENYITKD